MWLFPIFRVCLTVRLLFGLDVGKIGVHVSDMYVLSVSLFGLVCLFLEGHLHWD